MYQRIESICVGWESIIQVTNFVVEILESFISFKDMCYFTLNVVNSFIIGSSVRILSIRVKPFILSLQKFNNLRNLLRLGIILMWADKSFLPWVNQRFKFILFLICLNDKTILIHHCWFNREEGLDLLGVEIIEGITVVFNSWILFFFSLFYLELLFLHLFRLAFFLLFFLFLVFLFRDFGFLKPLLY